MEKVTIRHPDPKVGDAQVPASAVNHWRRTGWMTEEEYAEWQARQGEPDSGQADSAPAAGQAAQTGGEQATAPEDSALDKPDATASRAPRRRKNSEESA